MMNSQNFHPPTTFIIADFLYKAVGPPVFLKGAIHERFYLQIFCCVVAESSKCWVKILFMFQLHLAVNTECVTINALT